MTIPTGEQFEIQRGGARAVITEIGAGLRAFEIEGTPYLETFEAEAEPPKGAGQQLFPWPNRTQGATWMFNGHKQNLEVTEESRGNAIHGLTRHKEWTLMEHAESSITLKIRVEDEPGWPVPLECVIRYEIFPWELVVSYQVLNVGGEKIGFGVGAHPYFRLGDVPTDELTLTLSAERVRPLDATLSLPFGQERDVEGTEYDFRSGKLLAESDLDTAFGGLILGEDSRHHYLLSHKDSIKTLDIWTDPDFRWVQVFTPDDLVSRGRAVAIEPMTCPADALNSGTDLIYLEPKEIWRGHWGIAVR
jgi:aldose 1-epimerase